MPLPQSSQPTSEAEAWRMVQAYAHAIAEHARTLAPGHTRESIQSFAEEIEAQARIMGRQLGRGVHANPDLAIVSLGMNPPERMTKAEAKAELEREAYLNGRFGTYLYDHESIQRLIMSAGLGARKARQTYDDHFQRGKAFGPLRNPPNAGEVFGSDVLAIIYQHEQDRAGDVRVHTFGGQREAKWRETRAGRGVEVYDFPSATGVYMSAEGDKRVVMQHRRGLPLVQEF